MKNLVWTLVAVAGLGIAGTTPAYAAGTGTSWICQILPFLCAPPPVSGGRNPSVPEPETLAVLAVGVVASLVARRARSKK